MKTSAFAFLLLCSILAPKANAQDAISNTIGQIANANPAALITMGGQPFSEANFQALARAVGNVFNTLQILTLPYMSNQFNQYTNGIQNLNVLMNTLNSSLLRVNSTLNSQINALNSSTALTFQQVNFQISRLNTSVNQLTAYNCCSTVSTMNTQLTALISRNNIEHLTMNANIASLNSTIRIVNISSVANINAIKASVANMDAKVTAVIGNVSNVNTTLNAEIDALNSSFTQKLIDEQAPEDALFTYYNQTLGRLEANVSNLTNATGELMGLEAVVSNISDYLVSEETEENEKFGALNTSVLGVNETLNSLLTNVSSMNGTVNNLVGNISNLSQQIENGMAGMNVINTSLQGVAANVSLVNDSVIAVNTSLQGVAANVTSVNDSMIATFEDIADNFTDINTTLNSISTNFTNINTTLISHNASIHTINTNLSFAVYNKSMGINNYLIHEIILDSDDFTQSPSVWFKSFDFGNVFTDIPTVTSSIVNEVADPTTSVYVEVIVETANSATVYIKPFTGQTIPSNIYKIHLIAYGN